MSNRCSPEAYAIALAKHFVQQYPRVSEAGNVLVTSRCQRDGDHERPSLPPNLLGLLMCT
jgi:hypothetical protein